MKKKLIHVDDNDIHNENLLNAKNLFESHQVLRDAKMIQVKIVFCLILTHFCQSLKISFQLFETIWFENASLNFYFNNSWKLRSSIRSEFSLIISRTKCMFKRIPSKRKSVVNLYLLSKWANVIFVEFIAYFIPLYKKILIFFFSICWGQITLLPYSNFPRR